ncbi:hypothetical protein INR49_016013, partial [Caranx melampygus]
MEDRAKTYDGAEWILIGQGGRQSSMGRLWFMNLGRKKEIKCKRRRREERAGGAEGGGKSEEEGESERLSGGAVEGGFH